MDEDSGIKFPKYRCIRSILVAGLLCLVVFSLCKTTVGQADLVECALDEPIMFGKDEIVGVSFVLSEYNLGMQDCGGIALENDDIVIFPQ